MIELSLKLPTPIYHQLQAAAERENQSIQEVLVKLISQNLPPLRSVSVPLRSESLRPAQTRGMQASENPSKHAYDEFVVEWTFIENPDPIKRGGQNEP